MKKHTIVLTLILIVYKVQSQSITFEKVEIDTTFVSAGVTAADVNKDGFIDIVAGDVWYAGPYWVRREIRPLGAYYGTLVDPTLPRGSGASYYSNSIGNYTQDVNGDGWLDVIIFNSQGSSCYWYQNPGKNYSQYWKEYKAIEVFHNESPQMVDLFGDGKPVILAGHKIEDKKYSLSWFSIPEDPTQLWVPHVIGHPDSLGYSVDLRWNKTTQYFAPGGRGHGLGIGDVDRDGLTDVIAAQGWYRGTANARDIENWSFNPWVIQNDSVAENDMRLAQMFVDDFNGDGLSDFIGSAAHGYGWWWFEQSQLNDKMTFIRREIRMDMSQLHSMNAYDLDGDGVMEYIAGKRYLAHLGKDPGSSDPAVLAYSRASKKRKNKNSRETYVIDDNSGAGTQIWIADMNDDKRPDIITSNKKGTYLFLQKKK